MGSYIQRSCRNPPAPCTLKKLEVNIFVAKNRIQTHIIIPEFNLCIWMSSIKQNHTKVTKKYSGPGTRLIASEYFPTLQYIPSTTIQWTGGSQLGCKFHWVMETSSSKFFVCYSAKGHQNVTFSDYFLEKLRTPFNRWARASFSTLDESLIYSAGFLFLLYHPM